MQTSARTRDPGVGGYHVGRGHAPQISISDENHHVTEAIGDLYGDHQYGKRDSRPLSFLSSPLNEIYEQPTYSPKVDRSKSPAGRTPLLQKVSNEKVPTTVNGQEKMVGRSSSSSRENVPRSPTFPLRNRSPSDTANSQFPLNNVDYESNPAAVAQELSNLQALRRMSMDVNAAGDPDLPAFNPGFGMPSVAPTSTADEDDTSRLFWVPARLHPELAPQEFKTFLDKRVDSIKRRSGDGSLSAEDPRRQGSSGGLRRKKSMLSRQIDNSGGRGADGYTDGSERLDQKRSISGQEPLNAGISNLQDLEVLVNDGPATLVQRLSLETEQSATEGELSNSEDLPILPAAPPGNSLRRSTRTTYRRGSLRKGERVPPSRRAAKSAEMDGKSDSPTIVLSSEPINEGMGISRVMTEPSIGSDKALENFSRPGKLNRGRVIAPGSSPIPLFDTFSSPQALSSDPQNQQITAPPIPKHFVSQIASNGRSSLPIATLQKMAPHIVETPPSSSEGLKTKAQFGQALRLPERSSSHTPPPPLPPQTPLTAGAPASHAGPRQAHDRRNQSVKSNQTLNDMVAHPSPLPGNSTRTDSLSFIPTISDDQKGDIKKAKDKKEKEATDNAPRKSSWSWGGVFGSEEKEKERKKEEDAKKSKSKAGKVVDRSHDNTRLDVLQNAMDGGRGRESIVIDRNELKLEEERKKERSRKLSGGEIKKDKEVGIFSSFFGGGKKKGEKADSLNKKLSSQNLSPDPPRRNLKPDIDYSWTRFSIIEERAIYRMAHIKLANPRRALYSQVLLSNFMYSYLAKVQQMHPQIQMPQATAQKQQQRPQSQQAQRKVDQPEEFYQYQRYQEQQQQQQEQELARLQAQQQLEANNPNESQKYVYEGGHDGGGHRPQSRASQHSTPISNGYHRSADGSYRPRTRGAGQDSPSLAYPSSQFEDPRRSTDDDDMW